MIGDHLVVTLNDPISLNAIHARSRRLRCCLDTRDEPAEIARITILRCSIIVSRMRSPVKRLHYFTLPYVKFRRCGENGYNFALHLRGARYQRERERERRESSRASIGIRRWTAKWKQQRSVITDERTRVFVQARCIAPKPIKNYKCLAARRDIRAYPSPLIINLSRMNGRNSNRSKNSDFTAAPPSPSLFPYFI